jgi:hypothetical protein
MAGLAILKGQSPLFFIFYFFYFFYFFNSWGWPNQPVGPRGGLATPNGQIPFFFFFGTLALRGD